MDLGFFTALLSIIGINIVLSGDNAVVIALAARNLPPQHQKKAVLWGSGGAVILRVLLTIVAVYLLKIQFLQFLGGLLLIWIAVKLLIEEEEADEVASTNKAQTNIWSAVKTILIADVVMSLDNTLAIAGAAKDNYVLLIAGLALSIPLIVFGSTIIMKMMDRYPVIVYIGAGLIAWTSGEMIDSDKALQVYLPHFMHQHPYLPALLTVLVVGAGWLYNQSKGRTASDVLEADEKAAQRIDKQIDEQVEQGL